MKVFTKGSISSDALRWNLVSTQRALHRRDWLLKYVAKTIGKEDIKAFARSFGGPKRGTLYLSGFFL